MIDFGTVQAGDVVVDPNGKRWDVAPSGVPGGLRVSILVMDKDDPSPHRFIRSIHWPEYGTWTKE